MNNNSLKLLPYLHPSVFGVLSIVLLVPIFFWSTTSTMAKLWAEDSTYNHGFFIFPISIWLIFRLRSKAYLQPIFAEPKVLGLVFPVIFVWVASSLIGVNVTEQLATIALIPLIVWAMFGREILRVYIVPICFLFFSVPMGKSLIPPLMDITAEITVRLVALTGIPVYQEGLYFVLPSGNWSVVEACSGLNYLVASITLGFLFAYLNYQKAHKRVTFLFAIAGIAIVANGLRAYGIVMIGHFSDMEYGTGGDHTFYGWIFYGLVIFFVFYVANLWADHPQQDVEGEHISPRPKGSYSKTVAFAILALLASAQTYSFYLTTVNHAVHKEIELTLPENFSAWKKTNDIDPYWVPVIEGSDFLQSQAYSKYGKDHVLLNLGYYAWQSQGKEAVNSQNQLIHGGIGNWRIEHKSKIELTQISVNETVVANNSARLLIWQWYLIGSNPTSNQALAKLTNLANLVIERRNDASIIFIATPVSNSREHSRMLLAEFFKLASNPLHRTLSEISNLQPK